MLIDYEWDVTVLIFSSRPIFTFSGWEAKHFGVAHEGEKHSWKLHQTDCK